MGFEGLLGNEQLKENLRRSLQKGQVSHFYLISGPEGSGKHTLAKLLSAAIVCRGEERPCFRCAHCRKAMEGNHPDIITVEDPEHKNVAVKLVRQFRDDVFIRPNEADYKIYVFPQELGIEGQNALLKILEEPPSYGVFLMLTDNPQKLLPTVRSRCTELALRPLPQITLLSALGREFPKAQPEAVQAAAERSGGFLGQAKALLSENAGLSEQTAAFADCFARKDALALTQLLVPMEKWKREQLTQELQKWVALLQSGLAFRSGMPVVSQHERTLGAQRSPGELMAAITALQKAIEYAQSNVSVAAICGWLSWELR